MKTGSKKSVALILAALLISMIVIPAMSVLLHRGLDGKGASDGLNGIYAEPFKVFAAEAIEGEETSSVYTMKTMGRFSVDDKYLLLATNMDAVEGYSRIGYTISENGGEATDASTNTFYDSITFRTSGGESSTQTMEEIFAGNVVAGMIVYELAYDVNSSYSITPYMDSNDEIPVRTEGKTITIAQGNPTLSVPEVDPAYASGETTTVTLMEAENAVIDLNGSKEGNETWQNEFSEVNNLAFDFRLSNKFCTRNLNDTWTKGTSINFNFTSDQSYTVKMRAHMSAYDGKVNPYKLADNIKVRSEGTGETGRTLYSYADLTDKTIDYNSAPVMVGGYFDSEGEKVGQANATYFHFAVVELEVAVYEGANTISFEFSGGKGCNLDYIELDTSASITDWDDSYYNDTASKWYVSKAPTASEPGTFTVVKNISNANRTYTYALPALQTDGALTAGYTDEGNNTYSFDFKGEKYYFTTETAQVPDGYTMYEAGKRADTGNGKNIDLFGTTSLSKSNFSFTPVPEGAIGTTVISGTNTGDAMEGNILYYNGTIGVGEQFRMATAVSVTANKTHSFIYNFQNFGSGTLKLSVDQINSSNTVSDAEKTQIITLAPGDSVRVQIDISFSKSNNNALTLFTVLDGEITDMKLGIAMAAKLG